MWLRQGRYRNLWQYYLLQCNGIVFVIDSADAARLPVAFAELRRLLRDDRLIRRRPDLPMLVLANKSDLPGSADNYRRFADCVCSQCHKTGRPCRVITSCAVTGEGLIHGFEWLLGQRSRWHNDDRPTWYPSFEPVVIIEPNACQSKKRIVFSNVSHSASS